MDAGQDDQGFSRKEVVAFLTHIYRKKLLVGVGDLDGRLEDILTRLPSLKTAEIRAYTNLLLPPGRMGHVMLVLGPPEWSRGYSMIVWLLRRIDRE